MTNSIYIELTNECNLHCFHCYNSSGDFPAKQFDISLIHKIIQERNSLTDFYIALSGGEPLLHSRIADILQAITSASIPVCIVTNGLLLTDSLISFCASNNILLQISIDGPRQVHDTLRGKGTFDRVTDVLKNISRLPEKPRIIIKTVVCRGICGQIKDFTDEMLVYPIERIEFGRLSHSGRADQAFCGQYDIADRELLQLDSELQMVSRLYPGCISSFLPCYHCGLLTNSPDYHLRIDPYGRIFPCQEFSDPGFSLGKINDTSISEALHGARMNQLRAALIDYQEGIVCNTCILKQARKCDKGCMAKALQRKEERNSFACETDGDCAYRVYRYLRRMEELFRR